MFDCSFSVNVSLIPPRTPALVTVLHEIAVTMHPSIALITCFPPCCVCLSRALVFVFLALAQSLCAKNYAKLFVLCNWEIISGFWTFLVVFSVLFLGLFWYPLLSPSGDFLPSYVFLPTFFGKLPDYIVQSKNDLWDLLQKIISQPCQLVHVDKLTSRMRNGESALVVHVVGLQDFDRKEPE